MIIEIGNKNEYPFIPSIGGNRDLPESDQFKVIVKKINTTLTISKWARIEKDGTVLDLGRKLKEHIIRFENAPEIKIDGKESRELTIDDLFNDDFQPLFSIVEELVEFIGELENEKDGEEVKK